MERSRERQVGIEQARGSLGRLVDDVASGNEAVLLAKRGRPAAALVSAREYAEFKQYASEKARAELARRLAAVRKTVRDAGLDPSVVDEAIDAARRL